MRGTLAPVHAELNRRAFVIGASVTVGGSVVAGSVLTGCDGEPPPTQGQASTVKMRINGADKEIEVDNRTSLLDMLRERAGLTGTKKGCDQGACGACTVLLDGKRVNSCLTLAVMHDGAEVRTIEGVAESGRLHPLQQAFIDTDAFQCGYCTQEGHTGSDEEIREWMSGNICRCGAYTNIVAAIAGTAET
jgi:xanthine dehydrogenase YagT iron-sulfur-binding subunit